MAFSAKRRRRVARATDHTEKKSLACGNNGKYGKYGIHFQRSAVTMRDTRVRPCVTAGRHSKDFDQLSRPGRSSETMIILRTSAVFTVAVLLLTLKSYAQPIEVRPGEVVQFQLCFCWENLPGSPPASNLDVPLQPDVFAMSGYHWHHDSARPKRTIQPSSFRTSGDGCSPLLQFYAPAVAGMHPIVIYAAATTYNQEFWVGAWANNGTCCVQLYENQDLYYKPLQAGGHSAGTSRLVWFQCIRSDGCKNASNRATVPAANWSEIVCE